MFLERLINKILLMSFIMLLVLPIDSYAKMYMSASGKVVEAASGEALSGVKLVLISWTEGQVAETRSDLKGNFTLKKLPAGSYSLFTKLDEDNFLKTRNSIPVLVKKGKNVIGIKVELEQGGAITGRVITNDNEPIPSATIDASSGRVAYTNEDGYFVLRGVTPGEVDISVIPDHMSPKQIEVRSEKLKVINVGNIVFNIDLEKTIKGVIVNQLSEPISHATINSISDGYPTVTSMSREDGKFVAVGLEGTNYNLIISVVGYKPKIIKGVAVPTDFIKIELIPEPEKTSKLHSNDNSFYKGVTLFFLKFVNLFSPREAFADKCSAPCFTPFWSGLAGTFSAEFIALIIPSSEGGKYGKSFCVSNTNNRAGYKLNCKEIGVKVDKMISAGLGVRGVYTMGSGACCRDNLFDSSTFGGIFELGAAHYAFDVGPDFNHISLGINWTLINFWDWRELNDYMKKIKRKVGQIAERECTWEPVEMKFIDKIFDSII